MAPLWILSALLSMSVSAFNVFVDPNNEECFFEIVNRAEKVFMTYAVTSGGLFDIDVKVTGPDMLPIFEEEKAKEGSVHFVALQTGIHKFCFSNVMSTVTGKSVSFHIYVGQALIHQQAAKREHMDPLDSAIRSLGHSVHSVKDAQDFLRLRAHIAQATSKSTSFRVLLWNFIEFVIMASVSVINLVLIRNIFDKKPGGR
eukprot:gb/GEZN01011528.1/.p1 GENE.gb/GEZN01011528.1/~~gb/GEZN01011528.1/.p1  ORF type:complete len:200 (+),score=23.81 gb/GEZN01011528.1/:160-759(+)